MVRGRLLWLVLAGVTLGAGGCASAPNTGEGPAIPGTATTADPSGRRDRNRLTADDVADLRSRGALDALTMIQRARPTWLRVRSREAGAAVLVLYNERRLAGTADLRNIPADVVLSIDYIGPPASIGRYGREGEFGVILVRGR